MIAIDLGTLEYFDGQKNQFIEEKCGVVRFEYSLQAIYNWEGRWKKPFLSGKLSDIELIDFYKEMALDPLDDRFITNETMELLANYITDSNTATTFTKAEEGTENSNVKVQTAEELYALMFMAGVPLDFETRNFSRLLAVLRIISIKSAPPKKMTKADIMKQNAQLNAERKKQLQTKG